MGKIKRRTLQKPHPSRLNSCFSEFGLATTSCSWACQDRVIVLSECYRARSTLPLDIPVVSYMLAFNKIVGLANILYYMYDSEDFWVVCGFVRGIESINIFTSVTISRTQHMELGMC